MPDAATAPITARQRQRILITVLFGMAANSFPVTVLSASLPRIGEDLNATVGTTAWILTAPVLAGAVATPISGKLGDLYGHRRAYLGGFSLSVVMLALTATSQTAGWLIGFRVAAAAAGSITGPAAMAMIISLFKGSERETALGYWTATAALSPSLGVAIGGPLIDLFGWQMLFIIQAGIAAIALTLAWFTIPETEAKPVRFDIPGAITLGAGTFALMFAINRLGPWGLQSAAVLLSLALVPVFYLLFWTVERRTDEPLVPPALLRRSSFVTPVAVGAVANGAYMGAFVVTPLALEELFGFGVTAISLVMLPRPISFGLSASTSGHLGQRLSNRVLIGGGILSLAAGSSLIGLGAWSGFLVVIVLGLLAQGIGQGLQTPHLTNAVGGSMDDGDLGVGTGLMQMGIQFGTATGMTVLVAILGDRTSPGAYAQVFLIGGLAAAGAAVVGSRIRRPE
ncbi:MAG: MFS transporter [Acidimicrobiales bacterium]|nr:MFS transporter [Acidimicrobiales bacterium]